MKKYFLIFLFSTFYSVPAHSQSQEVLTGSSVPKDFISLADVDPTILIEMRYATKNNFVGQVIDGYQANKCFVTKPAAQALKKAQELLQAQGYTLKMYDCYRPARAVAHFVRWAKDLKDTSRQKTFYPFIDKKDLFKLGYIASKSGHSAGSTVDLTIVKTPLKPAQVYSELDPQVECVAAFSERHDDGSVDMGTGYDCFDPKSWTLAADISDEAKKNRLLLKKALEEAGFVNYSKEWWHYTLKNEPYRGKIFDFVVE